MNETQKARLGRSEIMRRIDGVLFKPGVEVGRAVVSRVGEDKLSNKVCVVEFKAGDEVVTVYNVPTGWVNEGDVVRVLVRRSSVIFGIRDLRGAYKFWLTALVPDRPDFQIESGGKAVGAIFSANVMTSDNHPGFYRDYLEG